MDLSFAKADDYTTPDSNPWGAGGAPKGEAMAVGTPSSTEGGFYDTRDDMVGGTDTAWNLATGPEQPGANWLSYGDVAPNVDAAPWSVTGDLSQSSLAGGANPDTPYGV